MNSRVLAVIPARLNSRRFPSKVLYRYKGRPLLYYVWREAKRAQKISRLVVATDSRQVAQAVDEFGGEVVWTEGSYATGSDRVAAAAENISGSWIMNLQADNIGLKASLIDRLIVKSCQSKQTRVSTLARRIDTDSELYDPSCVKVVMDSEGKALWFSRYPLPYLQDGKGKSRAEHFRFYKHIGVYLFRRSSLEQFAETKPSQLEKAESLEQLRLFDIAVPIRVLKTSTRMVSVDSPADARKLTQFLH